MWSVGQAANEEEPMTWRTLSQKSFFDPEFVCPGCLEPGTLAWLLGRYRSKLFPDWLLVGWRGAGRLGRRAWPAVVLMTLSLLRWDEGGMKRRTACRRAKTDARWRAAMGLQMDSPVPDEKTVREFETYLKGRHPQFGLRVYEVFFEHVVDLCRQADVIERGAVWAMDSTPMHCFGAVLDTVRLLGDGLRSLGTVWGRYTGMSVAELASAWQLPLLTTKSTKAAFRIDWKNADDRSRVISELATTVMRIVAAVRRDIVNVKPRLRKKVLRKCRNLLKVVADDLCVDDEGRFVVARRVTKGRLVSLTDPNARHGRKSKSGRFAGFKLHVLGDVVSGLIASLAVTPGNNHDSRPAPRLVRRARALFADITQVLGDTAYGGASLRRTVHETQGVRIVAPPPPSHGQPSDKLSKNEFQIDFDTMTATCPQGQSTQDYKRVIKGSNGRKHVQFEWNRLQCEGCPLAHRCPTTFRKTVHSILLHPDEEQLRAARTEWTRPEVREAYRTRSQCERLVHIMTRNGGRQARQWGLTAARQQAYVIGSAANLKTLARALAAQVGGDEARCRAG